jgi:Cytochrome P460
MAQEEQMKKWLFIVLVLIGLVGGWKLGASSESDGPRYTAEKKLLRPANYREWIFLSSGLGMNYGPTADHVMFTNVFVPPSAYREFVKTGAWPDKTMFALELYGVSSDGGAFLKKGQFQKDLMGLEVEVKDASMPNVWNYYSFDRGEAAAAPFPKEAGCFSCHEAHAAVEHSFVQFYPSLLEIARQKNTIKKGVEIPQ